MGGGTRTGRGAGGRSSSGDDAAGGGRPLRPVLTTSKGLGEGEIYRHLSCENPRKNCWWGPFIVWEGLSKGSRVVMIGARTLAFFFELSLSLGF